MRRTFTLALALVPACAAALAAGDEAELARGRAAAERFCYACHDREAAPRARNPLLPRLDLARFGTRERAYESVGRLDRLSPAMSLSFEGPDEERRALAAFLADAARREHARHRAQGRLALGAVVAAALVAAALALRRVPRR